MLPKFALISSCGSLKSWSMYLPPTNLHIKVNTHVQVLGDGCTKDNSYDSKELFMRNWKKKFVFPIPNVFFSIVLGLIQEIEILLSDSVVIFSHYIIILFVFYYSLFLIFWKIFVAFRFILTLPPCFLFLISPSYFADDHIFVSPLFSSSERFWYLLRASFWSFSLFFFLSNTQLVFCYVYEKKSKNNVISLCKLYELCNLNELRKLHESNL